MELRHSKLHQDLAGLSKAFEQLSSHLNEVAKEIASPGVLPSDAFLDRIATSRKQFEAVRSDVHRLAADMLVNPLPGLQELGSVAVLEQLLKSAATAEQQRAAQESEQADALDVLSRVLSIRHREQDDFKPLADCLEAARQLRTAITAVKWPAKHPESAVLLSEKHPLAALVTLVSGADSLADELWIELEEVVTDAYGRVLTVAASRGKLVLDEKEAPPKPTETKAVESKPVEKAAEPEPKPAQPKPPDMKAVEIKPVEVKSAEPVKAPSAAPTAVALKEPIVKPVEPAAAAEAVEVKPSELASAPQAPSAPALAAPLSVAQGTAQLAAKAETPKQEVPAPVVEAAKPAPVAAPAAARAEPRPPVVLPPAETPVIAALAMAVSPNTPANATESIPAVEAPPQAPVVPPAPSVQAPTVIPTPPAPPVPLADVKPAPAPVAVPKPPLGEMPRPAVAPSILKPVAAPPPTPRPLPVPPPERKETAMPRTAVADSPMFAPTHAGVTDPARRDPRLGPTPQPAKMETKAEKAHDSSMDDSKKVDSARPQRWGFWRGNR